MNVIYELNSQHIEELHTLYQGEWWTKGRTLNETQLCVNGSQICIGLIDKNGALQAFARVVTDYIFKAFIFDVIVAEQCRKQGLGDKLIDLIKGHKNLESVKSFELYCLPELEGFYSNHHFTNDVGGITLMRCLNI